MGTRLRLSVLIAVLGWSAAAPAQTLSTCAYRPAGEAFPFGAALLGRDIVVAAGHGWLHESYGWDTQREAWYWTGCGTCRGILEDFYNAEVVNTYLVPLLRQAGARVYSPREIDFQTEEIVVDDGDPGYSETGGPWNAGTSPALGFGGDYRTLHAVAGGAAVFAPQFRVAGNYYVSVRYAAGGNRSTRTRFTVSRGAVETTFVLDQTQDGSRWLYLGRFYFEPGVTNRVTIAPSGPDDAYVIADAVRFGGGIDATEVGGDVANKPRWQMAALHYLPYLGVPASVLAAAGGDVTVRPIYANWQGADLYLAVHGNATGDPDATRASGTSTYRFNCLTGARWEPLDPAVCNEPPGSAELQFAVQAQIVAALRTGWDPQWRDGGELVANFGEVRELDGIPGALVESAFFDGVDTAAGMLHPDNRSMHDPRFRRALTEGIYRGILDALAPGAMPVASPPEGLRVLNDLAGGLVAVWRPAAGAAGYRVYVAQDGRAFDHGTLVTDTRFALPGPVVGAVYAVRVASLNAGGEGFQGEAVAARYRGDGRPADGLLVSGFDREDAWVQEIDNPHDHVLVHALAMQAAADGGYFFDGAANEAVEDGSVALAGYRAVHYQLGLESTEHESFAAGEQALVAQYLQAGGCLVASGSEIGWDLVELGDATDQAFVADWLRAQYVADDADTFGVGGAPGSAFADLGTFRLDDGSAGGYDPRYPDEWAPGAGAVTLLRYDTGAGAAVGAAGPDVRVLLFGFPFETVVGAEARVALMERMLRWCGEPLPPIEPAEPHPEPQPEPSAELAAERVEPVAEPAAPDAAERAPEPLPEPVAEPAGPEPQPESTPVAERLGDTADPGDAADAVEPAPGPEAVTPPDSGSTAADVGAELADACSCPPGCGCDVAAGPAGSGAAAVPLIGVLLVLFFVLRRRGVSPK